MIIAGPCSIETKRQFFKVVEFLTSYGVQYIRGGIWKYRSDPSTFQGENMAMQWVKEAKEKWDFKFVCEIMDCNDLMFFIDNEIDVVQLGSRMMFNTSLLKYISKHLKDKTVLFKRHYCASLSEFVAHSKYLDVKDVWMCLRGAMSFHPQEQRFVPDISDIQRLREMTDNKIVYDVSHSACERRFISKIIKAALAFEPDGIMVEVHHDPDNAKSDPKQQLNFNEFNDVYNNLLDIRRNSENE